MAGRDDSICTALAAQRKREQQDADGDDPRTGDAKGGARPGARREERRVERDVAGDYEQADPVAGKNLGDDERGGVGETGVEAEEESGQRTKAAP